MSVLKGQWSLQLIGCTKQRKVSILFEEEKSNYVRFIPTSVTDLVHPVLPEINRIFNDK